MHLDAYVVASPAGRARFGLIVPKHGRRIVDRNRLKRRLRELARIVVLPALWENRRNLDVLVRVRREAYRAGFGQLEKEMCQVAEWACSSGR